MSERGAGWGVGGKVELGSSPLPQTSDPRGDPTSGHAATTLVELLPILRRVTASAKRKWGLGKQYILDDLVQEMAVQLLVALRRMESRGQRLAHPGAFCKALVWRRLFRFVVAYGSEFSFRRDPLLLARILERRRERKSRRQQPGLKIALAVLTVAERVVLAARFNLDGRGERSPREVAVELSITCKATRNRIERAMVKLRTHYGVRVGMLEGCMP